MSVTQIFKSSVDKVYHCCGYFQRVGRAELQRTIYFSGASEDFQFIES